ncbi:ribosome maturation factor RimP [Caldimonas sp. KR1-144]|uniref:ribosome maturation factor RimP n=1 Tax=Caldimonas sp. KR1-144 TaxID=3400911 RepID=UPI003C0E608F
MNWQAAIDKTVTGLGYELVDCERAPAGLLRVYIDRVPGQAYATGEGESVTVDDCEVVTRQLQYVLEVENVDYARLEVSSPGLDRPLKAPAHYARFVGAGVAITLKQPFQGRKNYQGTLRAVEGAGGDATAWELVFRDDRGTDQVLAFTLDEVREARLVPVVDFKGRKARGGKAAASEPVQDSGGLQE